MVSSSFLNKVKSFITLPAFLKYGHFLIIAYCLTAALSIVLIQLILGVLFIYWILLLLAKKAPLTLNEESCLSADVFRFYLLPVMALVFISCISAILGVAPIRAFKQIFSEGLYFCLPLIIYSFFWWARNDGDNIYSRAKVYLLALVVGQSIAALHSILSTVVGFEIPPRIPGAVTESGQLVLIIPTAVALVVLANSKIDGAAKKWFNGKNLKALLLSVLTIALVVNLKRGPWFGLFVASVLMSFFYSRRILLCSLVIALVAFFSLGAVRDRILMGFEHFSIEGGRKQMWEMGTELVQLYPLGIGPDNARFMRKLDPTLPELHRHMHNNLLNVTVETGWLGVCCYLWWLYEIIGLGFRFWLKNRNEGDLEIRERSVISLFLATALLGWQFAGFVEYNFGDSEIRTIALFFMGIILSLTLIGKPQTASSS